jgi:DNA-directed RNA polymerase subunit RPC12/RpoP
MAVEYVCWKCGARLEDLLLPVSRYAECRACRAKLHVCRMCEFYDPKVAKQCREPVAEEVHDKERANFCGYFSPNPDAYVASDTGKAAAARADLESLFGLKPGETDHAAPTREDEARRKLDELFGLKKDR